MTPASGRQASSFTTADREFAGRRVRVLERWPGGERSPRGQGEISTPPEMFAAGDHATVEVPQWGYVDPSYGNPSATTPYPSLVGDYEPTAVAGFAVVFYRVAGMWVPMPVTDAAGILSTCSKTQCQFRATPYSPPKS